MTAKDIQKQQEKEEEMLRKQQEAKQKLQEPIKIQKVEPKKAVKSTRDIQQKIVEDKKKKQEEERRKAEEEERKRIEEEERIALELKRQQLKEEKKNRKEQKKREQMGVQQLIGDDLNEEEKDSALEELLMLFKAEQQEKRMKDKQLRDEAKLKQEQELKQAQQEDDEDLDIFGEDGNMKVKQEKPKVEEKPKKEGLTQKDMRSPIVCVLGHVDTGKTSILDKIRASTVQQREEGGITQQIGASFLSKPFIQAKTASFPHKIKFEVPGLLIVDTPGHESFANLRSRGSSLADITVLVIDIMHGVEPQTIDSIELLKQNNTPFVIALNKIDRLYNWKAVEDRDSKQSIEKQSDGTQNDFDHKYKQVQQQMGDQGFFVDFWWNVTNIKQVVPIVPTSAVTGEGLCDLLAILIQFSQQLMHEKLLYADETQCTVLEVRKTEGFGFTLDCILVNGTLRRGQRIVLAGQHGPIVSQIRNLLTPKEAKELREASAYDYQRHEELQAAIGCKIAGEGLDEAVAGATVFVVEDDADEALIESLKQEACEELKEGTVKPNSEFGVAVHGNSLGALEALVGYLRSNNTKTQREPVNVSLVEVGPVTKLTVQEMALQIERGHPEYAVILAFDVAIDKDILERAKELKVTVIFAKIIYHLYDEYQIFLKNWHTAERERLLPETVVPCVFKPILIIHNRNPVLIGVRIVKGVLQLKQTVCLVDGSTGGKRLGIVNGIEQNKVAQQKAVVGEEVAIRIDTAENYIVGKDGIFDVGNVLCTQMNRKAIDILKTHYREELKEWAPVVKDIKEYLKIQ